MYSVYRGGKLHMNLMENMAMARADDEMDVPATAPHLPCRDIKKNSGILIFRLPNEILTGIFIQNARDSYASYTDEAYYPSPSLVPSWVNISHVCRFWRKLALDCPALWNHIPMISHRWTQELLARSGKSPFKICLKWRDFGDSPSRVFRIAEQAMNHSERIQEFHLDLDLDVMEKEGFMYDPHRFDHFPKLVFSRPSLLEHLKISISDPDSKIPEGALPILFEGDVPALRTLRLDGCPLPWYSLGLNGLTTLHVSCIPPHLHLDMVQFLAVLRRMPHLVHLCLQDALRSAHHFLSSGEVDATPETNLSCLSELWIKAPLSTVIGLLSCVNVPTRTRVRLQCEPEENHIHTSMYYPQLSTLLAQRIITFDDSDLTCRSLVIDSSENSLLLMFSASERERREVLPKSSTAWVHNLPLCVELYKNTTPGSQDDHHILGDICASIPLKDVRSVHFLSPLDLLELWRKVSRWLPNLQHIKLSNFASLPEITSLLCLASPHDPENQRWGAHGGQNGIFLPELEEIELCSLYEIEWEYKANSSLPAQFQSLCDAVSTRREARCRLTVTSCRVDTALGMIFLDVSGRWENDQFKVTSKCRVPSKDPRLVLDYPHYRQIEFA